MVGRLDKCCLGVSLVCVLVLMLSACSTSSAQQASDPEPAIRPSVTARDSTPQRVSALGRLEPEHGVLRVAASSTPFAVSGSVLAELYVEEGDQVESGQRLAVTESAAVMRAIVAEAQSEMQMARRAAEAAKSKADEACVLADVAAREAQRRTDLLKKKIVSAEETEQSKGDAEAKAAGCTAAQADVRLADSNIAVAEARLNRARTELRRCYIHAPIAGRVLEILTWPGELISEDGVLELGRVDRMYAIAEVYETDIRRVKRGQLATISSDALASDLTGRVAKIRQKVQKQDVVGTDPAARKDARIVEVEILLDDPEPVAGMTNLQVEIVIEP